MGGRLSKHDEGDEKEDDDVIEYNDTEDKEGEDENEKAAGDDVDVRFPYQAMDLVAEQVAITVQKPPVSADIPASPSTTKKRRRHDDDQAKFARHEEAEPQHKDTSYVRESNTKALRLLAGKLDAVMKKTSVGAGTGEKDGTDVEAGQYRKQQEQVYLEQASVDVVAASMGADANGVDTTDDVLPDESPAAIEGVDVGNEEPFHVPLSKTSPLEPDQLDPEQHERAEDADVKHTMKRKNKADTNASEDDAGEALAPASQSDEGVALVKKAKPMVSTSSRYRGVTQHRRTGRWEAYISDNGRQVYLGGFDTEERAGRAYDIVALKCRGSRAEINFTVEDYTDVLAQVRTE